MQVWVMARILEKRSNLITRTKEPRNVEGGRNWKDYLAAWISVKKPHFNMYLEENLGIIEENGEREIA